MKREGGGAEGGDFKRRTRPRRPVGRVAGALTQKMTEGETERERGPRCGHGLVFLRQRARERPQMATLSPGQKVHKMVLNREVTSHFK